MALFSTAIGQHRIWNKISPPKGVNWGGIYGITQDHSGFVWLATSAGLFRYDGYRFVSYFHDPENQNSLAFNRTESLCVSKDGKVWVGTLSKGLDRFDPVTNTFTHFTHNPGDAGSINDNFISFIMEDREGMVWIGTNKGLSRLNPDTGTFTQYSHNPRDSSSLSHNNVTSIYEDSKGTLWVGTGSYWDLDPTSGGLNRFNPENETFTRYLHDPHDPNSLLENKVRAIYEDSRGTFWVGTLGDGLHIMDSEKGTFTRLQFDPKHPDKLSRAPLNGRKNDGITFIHEDVTGAIWIGTLGSGLSRYDPKNGKVSHLIITETNNTGTMPDNDVFFAYNLNDGMLLIGTLKGNLYIINPIREKFFYQPTGSAVHGILQNADGKIWVCTENGLKIYDQSEAGIPEVEIKMPLPNNLTSDKLSTIRKDRKGVIWIGGEKGLWRWDQIGNTTTLYAHDAMVPISISEGRVHALHEDQDGILWVGTEKGLNCLDPRTGIFTRFTHDPDNPNSLGHNFVTTIREDKSGNLWVGTYAGLHKLNRETNTFKRYLEHAQLISAVREDTSGKLWIGSHGFGLYYFDRQKDEFVRYTDKSTGEYFFDNVRGIVPDDQGNGWVSSTSGLFKLDQDGKLSASYGEEAGLDAETFSAQGLHKGRKGQIFLGDFYGFYTFLPEDIKEKKSPPQIVLTDFRIFDKAAGPEVLGKGDIPLSQVEKIELAHNQNTLALDFAGIHFADLSQNRHFYKLDNYDEDWRKAGPIPSASYHKVPPGQYVFRVKAGNSEGGWAEKAISLIIHPPWWQTWWSYTLYGFIGLCFLVGLRQFTVNRERMKHELRIQKLEAEKLHEIDQLKSRFFANISHEFRTPLTLILGQLDRFLARSPEDNPDQPAFQMMHRNARRLQQLINHLLDLSKLEAGSMKLDLKPSDLMAFLKVLVFSFTSHAETKKIHYHFKYPPEQPVVYVDSDKLEKIITNLLSNAFKFTEPGGKISVTAVIEAIGKKSLPDTFIITAPSSTARMLVLRVQDSGIGIPQDQLDKIFDRFYQADTSHTRDQEGTGIGLSLVRELVELYSGDIKVESQHGHGSCFTVRIPVLLTDSEEIAITNPLSNGQKIIDPLLDYRETTLSTVAANANNDPDTPLVLIIEDNADVRSFIRETLQPIYKILESGDGEAGYKLAVKSIPDLILSDVMMPKMDGVEMCRKLKECVNTAHIPLILLTAKAGGADKIEGLETGADDYLVKPFDAAELLVRIKNLIDNRKKLRDIFSREFMLQPTSVVVSSVDMQFLQRIMGIIEEHIADNMFGIEEFGREAGMSKTQLFRKLKALTNHSPGDFIRNMRLKRAAELLSKGAGSIGEIAFKVGFQDHSYFSRCFQKEYGQTPSEFVNSSTQKT
ncbi:MAG TPA: two-component regulator propeller domain-containing protein [Lunatimonas sp.]|nr:two-component regulator propeller domain-containing protein [Lunatimonas sp.]